MGATVLVTVRAGADVLDTRQCRSVVLPDGSPGAVWRGLAYPLRSDDRIEVTDPAVLPSACVQPQAGGVANAHALLEGVEDAWLVVAGSVIDRDLVAARLKAGGITVLRTGQWLGDPVEGVAADWFVRFVRPMGAEPVAAVVATLIGAPAAAPAGSDALRLRLIDTALESFRAREACLQRELERAKMAASVPAASLELEVAALRDALAAERGLRGGAEMALEEAKTVLQSTQTAMEALRATPRPTPTMQLSGGRRRIADEIETALSSLLPGVRLLRDALTVISAEFRERGGLYRALAELQPPPVRLPPSWKKVQAVDHWWERHVSTGDDDAGRAYARWDLADRHWVVLVSHKSEQSRDIAWLRRQ